MSTAWGQHKIFWMRHNRKQRDQETGEEAAKRRGEGGEVDAGEPLRHRPPVFLADLLGHGLGAFARQQRQRLAQQRQHEVVAAYLHGAVEIDLGIRWHPVVLARPARPGALGPLDDDLEVPAGGELVEVVAGDVGVHAEPLGHLRGGRTVLGVAGEQVDAASSGVAEGVSDRRHGCGER